MLERGTAANEEVAKRAATTHDEVKENFMVENVVARNEVEERRRGGATENSCKLL